MRNDLISYKRCSEKDLDQVYRTFQIGFSDYMIPMNLSKEMFIQRFFGPEGNMAEHSFIAISGDDPVGIILGGIKRYEGVRTMRCGALAVAPEFRGKGISHELFALHKEEALKNKCKQLFLEVIVGNDRAIHFYKKLGYEKVYDLNYFSLLDLTKLKSETSTGVDIRKIDITEFEQAIDNQKYTHINWQNDIDYLRKTENNLYFGAFMEQAIRGFACVNSNGKIRYLFVDNEYRGRGIGASLLNVAYEELKVSKFTLGFPNNSHLEGFVRHIGFEKEPLAQFEMYQFL